MRARDRETEGLARCGLIRAGLDAIVERGGCIAAIQLFGLDAILNRLEQPDVLLVVEIDVDAGLRDALLVHLARVEGKGQVLCPGAYPDIRPVALGGAKGRNLPLHGAAAGEVQHLGGRQDDFAVAIFVDGGHDVVVADEDGTFVSVGLVSGWRTAAVGAVLGLHCREAVLRTRGVAAVYLDVELRALRQAIQGRGCTRCVVELGQG
jgi:hypothetical protein